MRSPFPARLAAALLAVAGFLVLAPAAFADGFLVPTRPDRRTRGDYAVTYHRVDVKVDGQHAHVRVDEEFRNLAAIPLESEYVFPLPSGAMVSAVTLMVDGRPMEGRLLRAEEARRTYDAIVRRQKDPALVEYLGRDFFRASIFPIPVGGARQLVLEYDHLLPKDGETVELVYPLNTEKFSAQPLRDVSVDVEIATTAGVGAVYSPSHEVVVTRVDAGRVRARFAAREVRPETDFLLYWGEGKGEVGATLLTHWPRGEDRGYFLLLATPTVPEGAAAGSKPRHLTFVLDVSSSMNEKGKLEQAKSALVQVLGGLADGDRFNVISFSTGVVPLWDEAKTLTKETRREATAWIEGLRGTGGTNIDAALKAALSEPVRDGLPHTVLFLTDGKPTIGETIQPEGILANASAANRAANARIFVFGVGVDIDTRLLDRLALDHHGVPTYVRPNEDIERKVSSLYDKIRYPVLTDLRLDLRGIQASEVLPGRLPDLFRGSQFVIAGRYRKGGTFDAALEGNDAGAARAFTWKLTAAHEGQGLRDDFAARVWAVRRIADLVDQIRLAGRQEKELVDEVVRLALRFGIVTEYTSFLADETADTRRMPELVARARDELGRSAAGHGPGTGGAAAPSAPADGLAFGENNKQRREADRPQPTTDSSMGGFRAPAGSVPPGLRDPADPNAPPPTTPPSEPSAEGKAQGYLKADKGGRDVEWESVGGVRQVANRAFYKRANVVNREAWVDAAIRDTTKADEIVERWSARFFELLASTSTEENARLSQEGDVLLVLNGRNVLVTEPAPEQK